jgi:hypothetical protein|tara:strand:- start:3287 stop:3484 length:198 start_codon:yes stop_codon:yes gene_type:complete
MEFLDNMTISTIVWSVIAILEVIFRITPSQTDNSILNKVIWIVEKLIPNRDAGSEDKFKLFKKKK